MSTVREHEGRKNSKPRRERKPINSRRAAQQAMEEAETGMLEEIAEIDALLGHFDDDFDDSYYEPFVEDYFDDGM